MTNNQNSDLNVNEIVGILSRRVASLKVNNGAFAVDIVDIYESSRKFVELFHELLDDSNDDYLNTIIKIESELEHINWHYKSLKKQLTKLDI